MKSNNNNKTRQSPSNAFQWADFLNDWVLSVEEVSVEDELASIVEQLDGRAGGGVRDFLGDTH